MPRTNEIRANMNNSSVQSTSSHETAYSVINGNVLNLLISLRAIEQSFYKEYKQLESDNKDAGVSRGHYNMMLLAGIMEILSATIKEMRVGPSQSVYRNRLQTITSCVLSNQKVVNVVCNKSEDMVRYV